MEIQEVFMTTLEIISEFKEQTSKIIGSRAFLGYYEGTLQSGLSRLDYLDTSDKGSLFHVTWEILEIIAEESEKATFLPGSVLKVAIIRGLQRDIRAAMRALND